MTEHKFKLNDKVMKVRESYATGEGSEAVGLTGIIRGFSQGGEWPPNSGRLLPFMYTISFPELYKNTMYEGVMLNVVEEDLELADSAGG
jgi:hypothetical protein